MDLRAQDSTHSGRASYYYYIYEETSSLLPGICVPLHYVNMVHLNTNGIYYIATAELHTLLLSVII